MTGEFLIGAALGVMLMAALVAAAMRTMCGRVTMDEVDQAWLAVTKRAGRDSARTRPVIRPQAAD